MSQVTDRTCSLTWLIRLAVIQNKLQVTVIFIKINFSYSRFWPNLIIWDYDGRHNLRLWRPRESCPLFPNLPSGGGGKHFFHWHTFICTQSLMKIFLLKWKFGKKNCASRTYSFFLYSFISCLIYLPICVPWSILSMCIHMELNNHHVRLTW